MRGELAPPPPQTWLALLVLGVGATSLAFWVQTWAQARLPAVTVALLFTSEPAWALLFGTFAGEIIDLQRALGAVCLLATSLLAAQQLHVVEKVELISKKPQGN